MNAQIRNKKGPNYSTSDLFAQMLYCNPINFPCYFPGTTRRHTYPFW